MTGKERVHAALNREPVDRVPVWMWYHPDTVRRLAQTMDIPATAVSLALGDDIRQAWVGNNHPMEGIVHDHDGESHIDDWGIEWVKDGPFNQIRYSPLQAANREQILAYRHPYERVDALIALMDRVYPLADQYFIGCDLSPCVFELVCRIRGMEQAAMDLAADPELSDHMLRQASDFSLEVGRRACESYQLDWLWTGDDIGGQNGMIMSPQSWRERIKPLLAEIFVVGHAHDLWVAYHSCGSLRPIIGDLIEIGMDVLNPIQCNCPGMDPLELKKEFGKQLAFMGGVDTQNLLPNGSAEEVYRETRRLLEGMSGDGGGYILAASHAVPPETPLENIFAMYRAAGITKEEIYDRAASVRAKKSV